MKINKMRIKTIILSLLMLLLAVPLASGQFRAGIKGGIAANKLHFDKNVIASDNRCGFTGGLQVEFSLPVTGLSLEGSLMYSHRKDAFGTMEETFSRDYIEIPVHLKYGLTMFGLNRLLVPYAFTGPNFSFLFNESEQDMWENRSSNTAWDLGFGVELFHHLQVSAAYSLGLTEAFRQVGTDHSIIPEGTVVSGRDHCWTITAAYLF